MSSYLVTISCILVLIVSSPLRASYQSSDSSSSSRHPHRFCWHRRPWWIRAAETRGSGGRGGCAGGGSGEAGGLQNQAHHRSKAEAGSGLAAMVGAAFVLEYERRLAVRCGFRPSWVKRQLLGPVDGVSLSEDGQSTPAEMAPQRAGQAGGGLEDEASDEAVGRSAVMCSWGSLSSSRGRPCARPRTLSSRQAR